MKFVLALLALATGASAFTPVGIRPNTFKSDKTVLDMPGIQAPIGFFDPAGFSETASPEAMLWFRAAELKHGRVAMLAFTGWIVNGFGLHFPGMLSKVEGVSFADLAKMSPIDAWEAVPESGRHQIGAVIFLAEVVTELGWSGEQLHYTKCGDTYDPLNGLARYKTPEKMKEAQNKELANGRLAMIGMMGFSIIQFAGFENAVPVLAGQGGHFA